ncbi:MAG: HAD family hydrolase [Nitrososphaeria archaeon]
MGITVVSFDVWDTLFRLNTFNEVIVKEISSATGIQRNEVSSNLIKAYALLKDYRTKGILRQDNIVNHCLKIGAQVIEVSEEILKRSIVKAVLNVDLERLLDREAQYVIKKIFSQGKQITTLGNVIYWPGAYNRILIEKVGLTKYFATQLYADELKCSKPSKKMFFEVCETFNVKPENIVHIGDNKVEDYEGALTFGSYSVLVNHSSKEELHIEGKGAVINRINKVLDALYLFEKGDY